MSFAAKRLIRPPESNVLAIWWQVMALPCRIRVGAPDRWGLLLVTPRDPWPVRGPVPRLMFTETRLPFRAFRVRRSQARYCYHHLIRRSRLIDSVVVEARHDMINRGSSDFLRVRCPLRLIYFFHDVNDGGLFPVPESIFILEGFPHAAWWGRRSVSDVPRSCP